MELSTEYIKMVEAQPILLLGGSRAGKTTFINSIRDYSSRDNFDSDGVEVFVGQNYNLTDADYNDQTYFLGPPSDNEHDVNGQPYTQNISQLKLTIYNQTFTFIDTPGIGDGRGSKYDDDNINNIKGLVNKLEKPPIVCVFIDSIPDGDNTMVALTAIVKLLAELEYDEIYFMFTKTRRSTYAPGEKLGSIAKVLPPEMRQKLLGNDHVFCFDNEGFRYSLIMSSPEVSDNFKRSYKRYEDNFRASWEHSKPEASRFLYALPAQRSAEPLQELQQSYLAEIKRPQLELQRQQQRQKEEKERKERRHRDQQQYQQRVELQERQEREELKRQLLRDIVDVLTSRRNVVYL